MPAKAMAKSKVSIIMISDNHCRARPLLAGFRGVEDQDRQRRLLTDPPK